MALRGTRPEPAQKRLKCLLFGPAGVGKTTASIQFPRPYIIDTERGAENEQYAKAINDAGGARFFTTEADDLIAETTSLLTEAHPYKTLVIDPLTVVYNDLLDRGIAEKGEEFGRYKIPADRKVKHLLNLLLRLDMNVVITSHAKPRWVRTKDAAGRDVATQDGMTFDCYPRLDYLFDLVLEIGRRGAARVATVSKTRLLGFPEGETFEFSYAAVADRYGRDILERDATPVALATAEQAAELKALIQDAGIPQETVDKWLTKAGADRIEEMPEAAAVACIKLCRRRAEVA